MNAINKKASTEANANEKAHILSNKVHFFMTKKIALKRLKKQLL